MGRARATVATDGRTAVKGENQPKPERKRESNAQNPERRARAAEKRHPKRAVHASGHRRSEREELLLLVLPLHDHAAAVPVRARAHAHDATSDGQQRTVQVSGLLADVPAGGTVPTPRFHAAPAVPTAAVLQRQQRQPGGEGARDRGSGGQRLVVGAEQEAVEQNEEGSRGQGERRSAAGSRADFAGRGEEVSADGHVRHTADG